ncbi:MAG: VOC family protein [Chitinophagaceae bacterium]|nr:VOC family protein [Chitinophagaceae bacterium]
MSTRISNQKITTNLWFNRNAEEAVNFYMGVFKNSRIGRVTRYTKDGFEFHQMPEGTVMTIEFIIEGQEYVALNGGPHFQFSEAISFIINTANQEETDYYWDKLTEGGDAKAQACGWLKDKFGVSWQVVPTEVVDMLQDADPVKVSRVSQAMFRMKKLDIAKFREAYGK